MATDPGRQLGLFRSTVNAVASLVKLSPDAALDAAIQGLDCIRFRDDPGGLAWTLAYRAAARGVLDLVTDPTNELSKHQSALAAAPVDDLDAALADTALAIDAQFFEQPGWSKYAHAVAGRVQSWLRSAGLDPARAELVAGQFPRYFTVALNREWLRSREHLAALEPGKRSTPFTPAADAELAWVEYAAWLSEQADRRLFEEDFGLQAVYVKSRAYVEEQAGEAVTRTVGLAEEFLDGWLEAATCGDALRVIEGDPGAGKSSLARTYAATRFGRLFGGRRWRVVFASLHHPCFDTSQDLEAAVRQFSAKAPPTPLADPLAADDRHPVLLILDGLDELSKAGHVGVDIVRGFAAEVTSLLKSMNAGKDRPRLLVLVCGRPVAVDAIKGTVRRLSDVINLLPFVVNRDGLEGRFDMKRTTLKGSISLLAADQRAEWWRKYGAATEQDGVELYDQIAAKPALTPVTSQPMLNYLVAFLRRGGWSEVPDNLCELYRRLLQKVYERVWEDGRVPATQGLTEEQFAELLEAIAYTAWRTGHTRTIRVGTVAAQLTDTQRGLLSGLEDTIEKGVLRLLFAFFVRPQAHDDAGRTYEFAHKTFAEYLVARKLLREVDGFVRLMDKLDGDADCEKELLKRWARAFGPTPLNEVADFLRDGIRLRPVVQVRPFQRLLARLIGAAAQSGLPMQELVTECRTFREMVRQSHNAEQALLMLHSYSGHATNETSSLSSRVDGEVLLSWLSWWGPNYYGRVGFASLNHLEFREQRLLHGGHLVDYTGSDLTKCRISHWYQNAQFACAILIDARCDFTDFIECDFTNANMSGASVRSANFNKSNVTLAQLRTTVGEPKRMPDGKPPWTNWRTRKPPKARETEWTRTQLPRKPGDR